MASKNQIDSRLSHSRGRKPRVFGLLAAIALGTASLQGCRSAHEPAPLPAAMFGNGADAQLDFWHTLAQRKVTSNDEAFHGLLLTLNDEDSATSYEQRVKILQDQKMLPAAFNRPADEAINRGTLAVAIVRRLQIKGGLTLRLIGPDPRYATRELVFMGLYPISSPNQTFSGTEFVGIIGKMEDYQEGQTKPVRDVPTTPGT